MRLTQEDQPHFDRDEAMMICQKAFDYNGLMLDWDVVRHKSRGPVEFVLMRQVVCVVLRRCGYGYAFIGHLINRDHASVINLVKKADGDFMATIKNPPGFKGKQQLVEAIRYYKKRVVDLSGELKTKTK